MIVLVDQSAARRTRTDVAERIDDLPEIRCIHRCEDVRLRHGKGLPKPAGELLVIRERMLDGVATLNRVPTRIESCELRIGRQRTIVQLNQPRILLLDYGNSACLSQYAWIIKRSKRLPARRNVIPVDGDRGGCAGIADTEQAGLTMAGGQHVRGVVARYIIDQRARALVHIA